MRIAISGGTGFIGTRLASVLLDRGDDVTLIARAETDQSRIDSRAKTRPPSASLDDIEGIVNLAGAGVLDERWTPARLELIRTSRIATTERLASSATNARVFVSASAVGYYGMRTDDAVLDESSPPSDDVLARICVDWENATRAAKGRIAIARIGIVLGKGGGALARLMPIFRRFVGGPIGSGNQWMSIIHVDDVVRSILFALDTDSFAGPFNATAPTPATMNDVARVLGDALHRPHALRVPATALKLAMGESANVLLTGQRVLPKALLDAGFAFRLPTLEGAIQSSI